MSRVMVALFATLILSTLSACIPSGTGPDAEARLRVMISDQDPTPFVASPDVDGQAHAGAPGAGELLDPGAIDAIEVTVTGVQVLEAGTRSGSGPGYGAGSGYGPGHGGGAGPGPGSPGHGPGAGMGPAGGSWVELSLATPMTFDLLALPAEGLLIADGSLEPGRYAGVRLLFEDATVVLARSVTTALGYSFDAGSHPLIIGGGFHDWIMVPTATFEVDAGQTGDVVLRFDPDASVRAIVVAGDGSLRMPPVLHAWAHAPGTGWR